MKTSAPPPDQLIQRTRFLVIDGNAAVSETIERYLLLSAALQVRKAASPLLALRVLQDARTPVDCVICAHDLKPMTGLEFLQNIRAGRYGGKALSDIKFILMQQSPDETVLSQANACRVSGHIVGQIDRDTLTLAVGQALRKPLQTADDDPAATLGVPIAPGAARLAVAHINTQGVDLIIVPVEQQFQNKAPQDQHQFIETLRESSRRAQMRGEVIPVWDSGEGGMSFIAPKGFHPYFQSINLKFVQANLNRELHIPPAG